ncbi:MAG: hypothetical protein QW134_07620 [Nitrososphaeria archaeon]
MSRQIFSKLEGLIRAFPDKDLDNPEIQKSIITNEKIDKDSQREIKEALFSFSVRYFYKKVFIPKTEFMWSRYKLNEQDIEDAFEEFLLILRETVIDVVDNFLSSKRKTVNIFQIIKEDLPRRYMKFLSKLVNENKNILDLTTEDKEGEEINVIENISGGDESSEFLDEIRNFVLDNEEVLKTYDDPVSISLVYAYIGEGDISFGNLINVLGISRDKAIELVFELLKWLKDNIDYEF